MAECKPFDRLDHGRAQPALEQLRDAILAEYPGKVEACSSGSGEITLKFDRGRSIYASPPGGHRRRRKHTWYVAVYNPGGVVQEVTPNPETIDAVITEIRAAVTTWGLASGAA